MSNEHLYVAVREAAAGTFDVLGELGTAPAGGVVYLAREIASGELAVLKLEPGDDGAGGTQYFLDVGHELDASVPDVETRCPRCRAQLRQWGRFCTQCGLDVSGEAPATGQHASRAALRDKVRAATAGHYQFLGDIPRGEGGGLVYFARDMADGKIVVLRLEKDTNQKFEVGVTRTLKPTDLGEAVARAGSARPALTIVQRTPLAATRRITPSQPPAVSTPNVDPSATAGRRWKIGRVEIAAAIAVALIIVAIVMRLRG
jgi:hypothetical protein